MIVETGEVIRLERNFVWVKTIRQSTCGACQARHGCGQKLLNQLSGNAADIKARLDINTVSDTLFAGDRVEIGISENAVVLSSLLAYGFPIVLLISVVSFVGGSVSEGMTILLGCSSLAFGAALVRWVLPRFYNPQSFEPVILRRIT